LSTFTKKCIFVWLQKRDFSGSLGLTQWSFALLPISIEKELMGDFLMVPDNATDGVREKEEAYYTSSKGLSRKKCVSATHLVTH